MDLVPESDTVLLWLARFPIEKNHPRPLTGKVAQQTHTHPIGNAPLVKL